MWMENSFKFEKARVSFIRNTHLLRIFMKLQANPECIKRRRNLCYQDRLLSMLWNVTRNIDTTMEHALFKTIRQH
ncbi:hypothetical protein PsorP6_001605 [Peronosclerospora sorghi]|uniref:Uncharacterized protein n=1 Tax=Peronosclerospora sorghi TaxID=230839 RepID=A0ACC0WUE9_9STRA|nr:hypothetical protein PsorP6_001605 [Peronosclerospora sorghi]